MEVIGALCEICRIAENQKNLSIGALLLPTVQDASITSHDRQEYERKHELLARYHPNGGYLKKVIKPTIGVILF